MCLSAGVCLEKPEKEEMIRKWGCWMDGCAQRFGARMVLALFLVSAELGVCFVGGFLSLLISSCHMRCLTRRDSELGRMVM